MEETFVIAMKKNPQGILEEELDTYCIAQHSEYLVSIWGATRPDEKTYIHMVCSTPREVLDWEFSAIFDCYDESIFQGLVERIEPLCDTENPSWLFVFAYSENTMETEQHIANLIALHKQELDDVFVAIKECEEEYILLLTKEDDAK